MEKEEIKKKVDDLCRAIIRVSCGCTMSAVEIQHETSIRGYQPTEQFLKDLQMYFDSLQMVSMRLNALEDIATDNPF